MSLSDSCCRDLEQLPWPILALGGAKSQWAVKVAADQYKHIISTRAPVGGNESYIYGGFYLLPSGNIIAKVLQLRCKFKAWVVRTSDFFLKSLSELVTVKNLIKTNDFLHESVPPLLALNECLMKPF